MNYIPTNLRKKLSWPLLSVVLLCAAAGALAQSSDNSESLIPGRRPQQDQPKSVKEYLAKQRAEKAIKDHEELLKRGEEVVTLTEQLETAFENNNGLTTSDRAKLASLEKLVTKIRKNLGGDDDDEGPDEAVEFSGSDGSPGTLRSAFTSLKEMSTRLLDELKRTTRFSISALAIQSSNSVLKIVRFLRLRK
jgi:hypothetical protein